MYNPQKPVKYGIKSYILCDSATGYCFNMEPYVGEGSTLPDTVFTLLDRLLGHGYTLYMDNFYNSVALCERLVAAQTNVCGTLRKNRGGPKIITEVTKSDLGAGGRIVCVIHTHSHVNSSNSTCSLLSFLVKRNKLNYSV